MAVMAADSVPQRMAATTIGMRKVSETGGRSWIYRITERKTLVALTKTIAMMTPVMPPGAAALRIQMSPEFKYFLRRLLLNGNAPRAAERRDRARPSRRGSADLSRLMTNMRTRWEQ